MWFLEVRWATLGENPLKRLAHLDERSWSWRTGSRQWGRRSRWHRRRTRSGSSDTGWQQRSEARLSPRLQPVLSTGPRRCCSPHLEKGTSPTHTHTHTHAGLWGSFSSLLNAHLIRELAGIFCCTQLKSCGTKKHQLNWSRESFPQEAGLPWTRLIQLFLIFIFC